MPPVIQLPSQPSKYEALFNGIGQGVSNATNIYLQSRVQDMFDEREAKKDAVTRERSAQGHADLMIHMGAAPKAARDEIVKIFSGVPTTEHGAVTKEWLEFSDFGAQDQGEPQQRGQAQGQGVNQPQGPMQQLMQQPRYQDRLAIDENEATAAEPPHSIAPEVDFNARRAALQSDYEDKKRRFRGTKNQEKIGKDYDRRVKMLENEEKSYQKRQDQELKRESLALQKEKSDKPSVKDENILENYREEISSNKRLKKSIDGLDQLVQSGSLDYWRLPSQENKKASGLVKQYNAAIYEHFKHKLFQGKITDADLRLIKDNWIIDDRESFWNDPFIRSLNEGKIQGLREMYLAEDGLERAMDAVRRPDGSYPKDAVGKIEAARKEFNNVVHNITKTGPKIRVQAPNNPDGSPGKTGKITADQWKEHEKMGYKLL
jgi:hypothetical protein